MTFMEKEIKEEPTAIKNTLLNITSKTEEVAKLIESTPFVIISGSGTSFHAGNILQLSLMKLGIPAMVIRSPELVYYLSNSFKDKPIILLLSQSGESKDILDCLSISRKLGIRVIGISNEAESNLIKNSDIGIATVAGREVSVAATKSFVAQLTTIYSLISKIKQSKVDNEIDKLLKWMEKFSSDFSFFAKTSNVIKKKVVILGNGFLNPIAMEGALKLKETSNLLTEAYNLKEYLHGPIQTLDKETTVIMLGDELLENTDIVEKIRMYAYNIIKIGESEGDDIKVLSTNEELKAIAYVVPLQILACLKTLELGLNPDRPSKLSKVVKI